MPDTPTGNAPAPAAPAPAPAPVTIAPSNAPAHNGPPKSAIELASEAARASIKEAGSAVPATGDPIAEPGERGRRSDGTFRPGPAKGEKAEPTPQKADAPADATPAPGPDATADDLPPDDTEEGDELEGAPAGDEGAESEDELLVVGPGRRPGEEFEISAGDKETAERLRQWVNQASRVEEVDQVYEEAMRAKQEVAEFEDLLTIDPAGVVARGLEGNIEAQRHLALYLLTRPEVWEQVRDTVLSLDDQERFELTQARVDVERVQLKEQFQTIAQENRAVDNNLREVQSAVAAIIPPEMDEAARTQFFRDALRDIAQYADRNNRLTVNVQDIPLIIAGRLHLFGIDPVVAAKRITAPPAAGRRNRSTENRTVSRAPASNSAPQTPPRPPQRTGRQMVQGARRKAVAAAIPGVGAGAQGNTLEKPPYDPSKGTSATEQAVEWHRNRVKSARATT